MQTGIYARISVEHKTQKDNSIENQILLARNWLEKKADWKESGCYIDRGYSGMNFNRPAFRRMMEDAGTGKLECIVMKDLSRLGRNHLETGNYLEKIFPVLGIRIISLGEGYDSGQQMPGSLEEGIRNLMNEWYAKDIGRKVKSAKKQQKEAGNYLGSRPPYGFCIVRPDGIRSLEPDRQVEKIVKKMNAMHQAGKSVGEIREWLRANQVNPPEPYRRTGRVYWEAEPGKLWDPGSIRNSIAHQRG